LYWSWLKSRKKGEDIAVLFWRVRAVFAMYGDIVDSKTNKPLFNKRAWKKAQVLMEY